MKHFKTYAEDIKIAYIGGGSRGWAWGLMSDLAQCSKLSGKVYLYDIDSNAARANEIIGNKSGKNFSYTACETIKEALTDADFVIISILPGTFDEMESDVHSPEKFGIYQSVGDTTGPGGIIRAMRTIPMYVEFANAIKQYCPEAWVINYTNPMAMRIRTLYEVFPKIKAFGCCHEVFGTQKLLIRALQEVGIADETATKYDIYTNPVGVNHFTWITKASYHGKDIFPVYKKFSEKYMKTGTAQADTNWMNNFFSSKELVKINLFLQFGVIAAAGDRHLAEFCPGNWFLKDPQTVTDWGFKLTPVSYRKDDLKKRLARSERLKNGEEEFKMEPTGEEGVNQICAILGLGNIITNVNMPNRGQIPNVPLGTVVETNAVFSSDSVMPQFAGNLPPCVYNLSAPAISNQAEVVKGSIKKDKDVVFNAFLTDRLTDRLSFSDAKNLFDIMCKNTKEYLDGWNI